MKVLECKLDQMIEMNKELESDNRRLRYVTVECGIQAGVIEVYISELRGPFINTKRSHRN